MIIGKSVQAGGTTIRSYVFNTKEKVILRSNKTYDKAIMFVENVSFVL